MNNLRIYLLVDNREHYITCVEGIDEVHHLMVIYYPNHGYIRTTNNSVVISPN